MKPQRNKITRLYLQLIAPLKTENVPEFFHNKFKGDHNVFCSQKQKREEKVCDQGFGCYAESSTKAASYTDQSNKGWKRLGLLV